MKKIGITGQNGFVGYHLYHTLGLFPDEFERIEFNRSFFDCDEDLDIFVRSCDVIVHLAALNRHPDAEVIYRTNISLSQKLADSLDRTSSAAHVIISSSTHEELDNLYGKSKRLGRELLAKQADKFGGKFSGLIIPNVFGPFGQPFYNSVVATFCHQITRNEVPRIQIDNNLKLIYVGELIDCILDCIRSERNESEIKVSHTSECRVSELLSLLEHFKSEYQEKGEIPLIRNGFEYQLFNTYRSYMDIANYFPRKFKLNTDQRGSFVEIIRLGIGGQVSFSTTIPGITRGNHFHTRKIERFAVIKGKALIQLRRIGTEEVHKFYLNGEEPGYVDMPIWYTHSIQNLGDDILYTNFWINEVYRPEDADTWIENV